MDLQQKFQALRNSLLDKGSVAVAYSGGVDSTLLLKVAHDTLGDNVLAITARVRAMPARELEETQRFCKEQGIRQLFIDIDQLEIPGFKSNPPDRCYLCKIGIFTAIAKTAEEQGIATVAEGSNTDDLNDFRPGSRAIQELGVASPLLQAGLSKDEIRQLSRQLGLPTWNKPSAACLVSRFAYGDEITNEGLTMVEAAEAFLHDKGYPQVRVRIHGKLARIEVAPNVVAELVQKPLRDEIIHHFKALGFTFVTLDLAGYRVGSMNEELPATSR